MTGVKQDGMCHAPGTKMKVGLDMAAGRAWAGG